MHCHLGMHCHFVRRGESEQGRLSQARVMGVTEASAPLVVRHHAKNMWNVRLDISRYNEYYRCR